MNEYSESEVNTSCNNLNNKLNISSNISNITNNIDEIVEILDLLPKNWNTESGKNKSNEINTIVSSLNNNKISKSANLLNGKSITYSKYDVTERI